MSESIIKSYKKGERVPSNHPCDLDADHNSFSEAYFGCDIDLTQNRLEFRFRPNQKMIQGECMIKAKDMSFLPEWVGSVIMFSEPF